MDFVVDVSGCVPNQTILAFTVSLGNMANSKMTFIHTCIHTYICLFHVLNLTSAVVYAVSFPAQPIVLILYTVVLNM